MECKEYIHDLGDGSQASPAVPEACIYLKGRRYLYCVGGK
jgi:hypothetical protein